jgi:MscS family membrane protein
MNFDLLTWKFLGNTIENYLYFAGIILIGLLFKNLISKLITYFLFTILKQYFKTVGVQKFVDLITRPFSITIFLIVIYAACRHLHFPDEWHLVSENEFGLRMTLNKLFLVILTTALTWTILRCTDYLGLVLRERAALTISKMDDLFVPFFISSLKAIITIIAFMYLLGSVFELNVASIIAGLGIGGLAIALASKDTLENLLGSFLIFLDKPFVVGDLVKVNNLRGHVEEVGFRTTKIRTIEKTLVTVPNKRMMDAELENQTERTFFRHKFTIGLIYSTTESTLKNIINEIKSALNDHPLIKEDPNVFFVSFGINALEIEITYFVLTQELKNFEKAKEEINFKIMEIVSSNGSAFAFPSTSVYIEKEK